MTSSKYMVDTDRSGIFNVRLKLPSEITCERCVLQWSYTAGNNWGRCADGKRSATGCGPQETFRGCADVRIEKDQLVASPTDEIEREGPPLVTERPATSRPLSPRRPPVYTRRPFAPTRGTRRPTQRPVYTRRPLSTRRPVSTRKPGITSRPTNLPRIPQVTRRTTLSPRRPTATARNTAATRITQEWISVTRRPINRVRPVVLNPTSPPQRPDRVKCGASSERQKSPGMDVWCENNCARGFCPPSHCQCK